MASPNPDSFDRALNTFKQSLSPPLLRDFSISTLDDLKTTIRDIQREAGRDGKLRNMRRLSAFIEGMEQFGKVIDTMVNAHQFVCFIWGPMKFILNIAKTHMDAFGKLLDAYAQIGDAIPGLMAYRTTFERHPTLAAVLEDYYSDILRFQLEALKVFNRGRWKNFLHATWKTFDTAFSSILQSLMRRRQLLESEKTSASLYEIQSVRNDIEKVYEEQTRQATEMAFHKHQSTMMRVKQRLRVAEYQMDQIIYTNVRHRNGDLAGQWVFKNPEFLSWSDKTSHEHAVLYVNGIPGAGKTTLMSTIIDKFLDDMKAEGGAPSSAMAYFYFRHSQEGKKNHNDMLRALLAQLLDRGIAMPEQFYNELSSAPEERLRSTRSLESHLKELIESYQTVFLILDGLDACDRGETEQTLEWLLSLVDGGLKTTHTRLRLIFSGQRDGILDSLLAKRPSISLESSEEHLQDISRWCQTFLQRKKPRMKLKIDPGLEGRILDLVTKEARGMFLYAQVVLENLCRQTSIWRLNQELQPETFPRGLEAAYDRVIARVIEEPPATAREDALTVLKLVLCAKRPLRWREIQAFFCIRPENDEVDYRKFLQVDCKELCGALVDAHRVDVCTTGSEDFIEIVHDTARRYLGDRDFFDATLENEKLSLFCTQYLSSGPFRVGIDPKDVLQHAKQGYYSFQDYAAQYWFDHLRHCVESPSTIDPIAIGESTQLFLSRYQIEGAVNLQNDISGNFQVIETIKSLPESGRQRNSQFNIEFPTLLIRQQIANLGDEHLTIEESEIVASLYGRLNVKKCPKPWCQLFPGDLRTAEELREHVNRHELPFCCPSDGCFAAKLGFSTQSNLNQHMRDQHAEKEQPLFPMAKQQKTATIFSGAESGNLEAVEKALDSGEDINQTTKPNGAITPLILAIRNGQIDICRVLLSRGALWVGDLRNRAQVWPLWAAVEAGRADMVSLMLQYHRDRDDSDFMAMGHAMSNGRLDIIRAFVESGFFEPASILDSAIKSFNKTAVQYLLQNGLEQYVKDGHLEQTTEPIIRLLLSTGRPTVTPSCLQPAILGSQLGSAKLMISYPKTNLSRDGLEECLKAAEWKQGFGEVSLALRALLDAYQEPMTSGETHDNTNCS